MKKRKDGRYAKQITVSKNADGKPIKKTVYGSTLKELDENYRKLMFDIDRGLDMGVQTITVSELRKEWYRVKKEPFIKPGTKLAYKSEMEHIDNNIGHIKVRELTSYQVEAMLDKIKKEHPHTAKSVLFHTSSIMRYAVSKGIIVRNPCEYMSVKAVKKARRALTDDEKQRALTANLPTLHTVMLHMLLYSGLRRGELLALEKSDVDLKNGTITVNKTLCDNHGKPYVQDTTKTEAGERIVPIFEPLKNVLSKYMLSSDNELLFPNERGKYISSNSVNLIMKKIKQAADLPEEISFHCFRHTFVTDCYKAGIDIKTLQEWVGHSDIQTTLNIYTHLDKQTVKKSNKMDEYYRQSKRSQSNIKIV